MNGPEAITAPATWRSLDDDALIESYTRLVNPAYPSFLHKLGLDRVAARAEGTTITDSQGKTYIDCAGGYGLFNLGHNSPVIIDALVDQLSQRQQLTKPFITDVQVHFATCLEQLAPGDLTCSFLCNSGSEAIDSAIKLARLHTGATQIIAAEKSFHGYTLGALSASGIPSFKRGYGPLLPGFSHVPFGDAGAIEKAITAQTAAILLEPIQHEAGVLVPPDDYLREVRRICNAHNILLILDEIKTGIGKTGRMFACEHCGVTPDILVLGKALGGGVIPIGALLGKSTLWRKFGLSFPMSASSFAGNALACRAGIATLQHVQASGLLGECTEKGRLLMSELRHLIGCFPHVLRSVDGAGLLIGLGTCSRAIAIALARAMIQRGVLMLPAFANPAVLMVEPPLVITVPQLHRVLASLRAACEAMKQRV